MSRTQHRSWKTRLAGPLPTAVVTVLFSALIACGLRLTWNPGYGSYVEYVPIGGVLAAFLWDRAFPSRSRYARDTICDVAAVALALMRVFVPPLPFVSGHTLFAAYAGLTARRWPLTAISLIVLAQVAYVKLFVSAGWRSMLGGLAVAALLATVRRRTLEPGRRPTDREA